MSRRIMVPGDPGFSETLLNPPPDWTETASATGDGCAFVEDINTGLLRPATPKELEEYMYGGEGWDIIDRRDELLATYGME